MGWLWHLLGIDAGLPYGRFSFYNLWSGFASDIGEVTIVVGVVEMVRRGARHHRERLAQAARHQIERLEQAKQHHAELKMQAAKHHQEALDRADVHAEAVRAHVDAVVSAAAPRKRGM